MIEKMKKITFLVYHRDYEDFLHRLQDLGAMHVVTGELNPDQSEALSGLSADIKGAGELQKQMTELLSTVNQKADKMAGDAAQGEALIKTLTPEFGKLAELRRRCDEQEKQLTLLQPWGDFDPAEVNRKMQTAGCQMQFYTISAKAFKKEILGNYPVEEIATVKGTTYFVCIAYSDTAGEIPATRVTLPEVSLSQLTTDHAATQQELQQIQQTLVEQSQKGLPHIQASISDMEGRMQFDTIKGGTTTAADNRLMVLNGWLPASRQADLEASHIDDAAWYQISDPTPDDDIPICLKNNRFFRLFEMITSLYMLPKYNELDLTPFFAPFYIVFFGLCLGDSGYGLFITLAVLAVKFFVKNMGQGLKSALNLLLTMGISAFVFGFLSGTFFGFNVYDWDIPFLNKLGDAVALDNSQMFNLSLILGFIQIIFGMILKVVNKTIQFGFRYSLSSLAWMIIILALAVGMFVPSVGHITKWIAIGALVVAFCYNSPDAYKKPLTGLPLNIGLGLWDAYNMATGMLGDMLSYIRLFALGLSGGIVASVFNSLAAGFSPDNVILGPLVFLVIFVFGHALNMFMNVLGAFVHPMRLTFVEFFKNSGYEGGGLAYNPFKK